MTLNKNIDRFLRKEKDICLRSIYRLNDKIYWEKVISERFWNYRGGAFSDTESIN